MLADEQKKLFGRLETHLSVLINRYGDMEELEVFQQYVAYNATLQQQNKQLAVENEQLSGQIDGLMQRLEDKSPYSVQQYWEWLLGKGKKEIDEQNKQLIEALDRIHTDSTDSWAVGYSLRIIKSIQGGNT
jgi:uncharacterized coiled-coil protein SlyX